MLIRRLSREDLGKGAVRLDDGGWIRSGAGG
jgi:hypothetical protein